MLNKPGVNDTRFTVVPEPQLGFGYSEQGRAFTLLRGVPHRNTPYSGCVKRTDAAAGCPEKMINPAEVHKPVALATFHPESVRRDAGPARAGANITAPGVRDWCCLCRKNCAITGALRYCYVAIRLSSSTGVFNYSFILKFSLSFKITKTSTIMVSKKLMLPILAVIVGVAASAFTVNTHKTSPDSLWYFQLSGTTYQAITLPPNQAPPTTPYCSNTLTDQCDGGFTQSNVTVTTNPDGTQTYTPNTSPTVKDYRN